MSESNNRSGWLRLISTTLLFCLVPFGVYYFAYYQSTLEYQMTRSRRTVSAAAQRAEDRLAAFRHVLRNASDPEGCLKQKLDATASGMLDKDLATLCPDLNDVGPVRFESIRQVWLHKDAEIRRDSRLTIELARRGTRQLVRLVYQRAPASDCQNAAAANQVPAKGCASVEVQALIAMKDFIGDLDPDRLFDEMAIIDGESTVLLQTDAQGARLAQFMRELPSAEKRATDDKQAERKDISTSKVQVGGETYLVFRQPLQLDGNSGESDVKSGQNPFRDASVFGLVRESQLRRVALSLPAAPMLVLLLLLLLAMAAWPFLKVALLGRNDRLRALDLHLLKVASASIVGLLTIFMLGFLEHGRLRGELDHRIERIARQIQASFTEELGTAANQLVTFERELPYGPAASELSCCSVGEDTSPRRGAVRRDCAVHCNLLASEGSTYPRIYPALQSWISLDLEGKQIEKWSVKPFASPLRRFRDRRYVSGVASHRFDVNCTAGLQPWCGGQRRSYIVEPLVSRTTGEKTVAISMAAELDRKAAIVQIATKLMSVWNTVLPLGFEFAIVDAEGNVLHHLDEDRALEENLFRETDGDEALQAVVESDRERALTVNYHGEKHRALVVPLGGSPWTLVVLSELVYIQTIVLETIISSLALLACLLVLIGLVRVGYMVWLRTAASSWTWPSSEREKVIKYRIASAAFAGIIAVQVAVAIALGRWSWEVALAGAGVALLCVRHLLGEGRLGERFAWLWRGASRRNRFWRAVLPNAGNAYVVAVVGALCVIVVSPSIGFFYRQYGATQSAFISMTERRLRQDVARRSRVLREEYLTIKGSIPCDANPLDSPAGGERTCLGYYAPESLTRLVSPGGEHLTHEARAGLDMYGLLPALNRVARLVREAKLPSDPERRAAFAAEGALLPGPFQSGDGLLLAAALGLILLITVLGVRVTARHVFGLGAEPLERLKRDDFAVSAPYVLHLCLPDSALLRLEALLASKVGTDLCSLDLRRPDWNAQLRESATHLILHHFENLLLSPEAAARSLVMLEKLAYGGNTRIVVCSHVDPVYYLNERRQDWKVLRRGAPAEIAENGQPIGLAMDELPDVIRWAQLFSRFDRVHHYAPELSIERAARDSEGWPIDPRERTTFSAVLADLESECCWDEQLHMIAKALHEQRDVHALTRERLLQQIGNRAAPRHRFLWSLCTNTEKILLVHLAQEGSLNPRNWDIAHILATRGLLRYRYGRFQFSSQSFQRFVLQAMRPQDLARLRQPQSGAWGQISAPLGALLVSAFVFFFWSQPGMGEVMMGAMGAGTAGAAAVMKLLAVIGATPSRGSERG
jgi:hypothetical protein